MADRTRSTPKRLALGRETLRSLSGMHPSRGEGRETCRGGCSCLCGPDTFETTDAA